MAEQNIVMKQLNNAGEYDTLYPATTAEQAGALPITGGTLSGDLFLAQEGNYPEITFQYLKDDVTAVLALSGTHGEPRLASGSNFIAPKIFDHGNNPTTDAQLTNKGYVDNLVSQAIASGAKIATGSYTGTGNYGQNSSNSLTFESDPVLLLIAGEEYSVTYIAVIICDANAGIAFGGGQTSWFRWGSGGILVTKTGNKVDWYTSADMSFSDAPAAQMNISGVTYTYAAILS